MKNWLLAFLAFLFATTYLLGETPTQRVGLPLLLEDLYLKGPLLEPVPRTTRESPLMLRMVEVKPAQDGFRYTIEVQGLDAGDYNLGEFLREAQSESGHSSHQVPITITTALPPGLPRPAELQPKPLPRVGGYRALLWVLGLVWVSGLVWVLFAGRKNANSTATITPEPTLAERLEPLLKKASQEELNTDEQARLERLVLGHWREKVPEVAKLSPSESLAHLRKHPEASPLLLQLERWLHSRDSVVSDEEIQELLTPYRS
ncbi:hypothetical protein [Roseibacillus persicicus]|uniref:hypothetical protein n=1 Tax=Roseibacillus persicicus TaxID=454148 RepID=UPI00280CCE4C|nr:hypothetical protein [Roseibacillus persicicus]MDQ8189937.1 hypothetical protein [Roseibacillus persicicus]